MGMEAPQGSAPHVLMTLLRRTLRVLVQQLWHPRRTEPQRVLRQAAEAVTVSLHRHCCYSPAGCPSVVGGILTQSAREAAGGRRELVPQPVAQSSQQLSLVHRSSCWMAGDGCVLLCSSYSPIGSWNLSQGRLETLSRMLSPMASQVLARAGLLPRGVSFKGVGGGCHLTGPRSCIAPAYTPSSLACQVVQRPSQTRLSRGGKELCVRLGGSLPPRGNRTVEPPGRHWGNGPVHRHPPPPLRYPCSVHPLQRGARRAPAGRKNAARKLQACAHL